MAKGIFLSLTLWGRASSKEGRSSRKNPNLIRNAIYPGFLSRLSFPPLQVHPQIAPKLRFFCREFSLHGLELCHMSCDVFAKDGKRLLKHFLRLAALPSQAADNTKRPVPDIRATTNKSRKRQNDQNCEREIFQDKSDNAFDKCWLDGHGERRCFGALRSTRSLRAGNRIYARVKAVWWWPRRSRRDCCFA